MLGLLRARSGALDPALGLLAFIAFIAQVGVAVMLPLLPLFATELGASPFELGLLTSAFAITNGIGQLGAGFMTDRYGARRLLSGGLALYASMNALIATAATATWLLTWRALSGFGGGALIVSERLYIVEVTRPERRAFANGIVSAAGSAGTVMGPAFGGLIAAVGGLRAPFVVVATTSAIAFVASLALRRRRVASDDTGGSPTPDDLGRSNRSALAALLVANIAVMAGYGAFITTYAPFATQRLAWTTVDVGVAFSFLGGGSILLGPALAHLADRTSRRAIAMVGTIPVALFGIVLVLGADRPIVWAVAFIAGGGLTAYNAAWYALLADASGARRRGRTFGIVSAISNAGIVLGATAAAQLWERVDLSAGVVSASVATLLPIVPLAFLRIREAKATVAT
ncbi:MAG TPA: MFS transporter [Methylomirabilota bacterium]|nr:MFS transporter [Methylomirabilota bacterium]